MSKIRVASIDAQTWSRESRAFVAGIQQEESTDSKVTQTAAWIFEEFQTYYGESRKIPGLAKKAFEQRDPRTSLTLSRQRLTIYSDSINRFGALLKQVFPLVAEREELWDRIAAVYLPKIEGRYEADLAFAYLHSVRRKVYQGEWKPVAYSFQEADDVKRSGTGAVRQFLLKGSLDGEVVSRILAVADFDAAFRNVKEDASLVADRIRQAIAVHAPGGKSAEMIELIDAGFYRNRGAYLIGRVLLSDSSYIPLVIALLNSDQGIYADAVLCAEQDAHNIFSSTLANFHATNPHYHELSAFLHSIMPVRPLGLHYSTIGYNHVGKVAIMNELRREVATTREVLGTSVGSRGTVAIGFSMPSSQYHLKVIRDHPTEGYKWGAFDGVEAVLGKYGRVHEINRTGSMLDNVMYFNVKLDRDWFDEQLLVELQQDANASVNVQSAGVIFKHLIAQRKLTPLPIFLEAATREESETAVINLGYCIKNNAAANIFNKDLDSRNYGVNRFLKVYLYDYDALEPIADVKIRSNVDRFDGEEDVPDWYFEDGVVFLPEEVLVGLRIPDRSLRRLFLEVHGDLLSTDYWERLQRDLGAGYVPSIRVYPESSKLRSAETE